MPIIDYFEQAKREEKRIFLNNSISPKNKEALKRFLTAYQVSPARHCIFLKHIRYLLEEIPDITKDMSDRNKINNFFHKIQEDKGPAYHNTIINVSLRFVRWLNDGEKPAGFKDIKNQGKKKGRRDLNPDDMITWEEGVEMSKKARSPQLAAIITTQLDGGFRPSEFIDLRYGDVKREGQFMVVNVRAGKTGPRSVTLFNCVPFLQVWLHNHPTKNKNDPLWIVECPKNSHGKSTKTLPGYQYDAIKRAVERLMTKCHIKKPGDFYNLRHSAVTIAKLDNMPDDLAAQKFGHSITFYKETYGRLSQTDVINRFAKHYGLKDSEEAKKKIPILCPQCKFINQPGSQICAQCGRPLTGKKANEILSINEKRIKELESNQATMAKQLAALLSKTEKREDIKKAIEIKKGRVRQ